jgi:membrane protein DedA with SNARE-associated domain
MVSTQQCLAIVLFCLFIGIFAGMVIWYYCGNPKCNHEFEKIVDDIIFYDGKQHITVVHMCKKCGKRKITKV